MFSAIFLVGFQMWVVSSPPYFPKCCIDDPYLDDCLVSAANYIRPYLRDGLRDLDLVKLDPAVIPKLVIADKGPLTEFSITTSNFSFYNVHNYVMREMHFDEETLTLSGRIFHQKVPYTTFLEIDTPGQILNLELKGNGTVNGYLGGVDTTFETRGQIVRRFGKEYYKALDTRTFLTMEENFTQSNGVLGPDKEIENKANQWLADNTKLAGKALSAVYEKIARQVIHMYIASLTKNVPFDRLFPTCYII